MSAIENQFVSIPETMGIEIAQLHDDGKRIGTRNMDHLVRIGESPHYCESRRTLLPL